MRERETGAIRDDRELPRPRAPDACESLVDLLERSTLVGRTEHAIGVNLDDRVARPGGARSQRGEGHGVARRLKAGACPDSLTLEQFGELAKESNTLVLPANVADVGSMIALAMKSIQSASPEPTSVPPRRA